MEGVDLDGRVSRTRLAWLSVKATREGLRAVGYDAVAARPFVAKFPVDGAPSIRAIHAGGSFAGAEEALISETRGRIGDWRPPGPSADDPASRRVSRKSARHRRLAESWKANLLRVVGEEVSFGPFSGTDVGSITVAVSPFSVRMAGPQGEVSFDGTGALFLPDGADVGSEAALRSLLLNACRRRPHRLRALAGMMRELWRARDAEASGAARSPGKPEPVDLGGGGFAACRRIPWIRVVPKGRGLAVGALHDLSSGREIVAELSREGGAWSISSARARRFGERRPFDTPLDKELSEAFLSLAAALPPDPDEEVPVRVADVDDKRRVGERIAYLEEVMASLPPERRLRDENLSLPCVVEVVDRHRFVVTVDAEGGSVGFKEPLAVQLEGGTSVALAPEWRFALSGELLDSNGDWKTLTEASMAWQVWSGIAQRHAVAAYKAAVVDSGLASDVVELGERPRRSEVAQELASLRDRLARAQA